MKPRATLAAAALVVAAFGLGACGGCGDDRGKQSQPVSAPESATSAEAPAPAFPDLVLSVGGQRATVRSVLAYSRGGRALQLALSTHPLECKHLARGGTLLEAGEKTLDVTVAPLLYPDGDERWAVTRARLGQVSRQGELGTASVTASDPKGSVKLALDATLVFPPPPRGKGEPQQLLLKGDLVTQGCGVVPLDGRTRPRPQLDVTWQLAGERIAVRGASLARQRSGALEVRLTSEPHGCEGGVAGSDFALTLALDESEPLARSLRVEGYGLGRLLGGKLADSAVEVRLGGDSDRDREITVELAGRTEQGGYAIVLDGRAVLENCLVVDAGAHAG
jgi:hypothetical protein